MNGALATQRGDNALFPGLELIQRSDARCRQHFLVYTLHFSFLLAPATTQGAYLINRMRRHGILMSTDGPHENVLKIKPPMVFGQEEADFLLETLDKVMREDTMQI